MQRFSLLIAAVTFTAACADAPPTDDASPAFVEHDEASDFDEIIGEGGKADVVPSRFDPNWILGDKFFEDVDAVDVDTVQAFLDHTPYGSRSWLADEKIGGESAAHAILRAAETSGINPIVFLVRMQVEMGHVSKTVRPSQKAIDYAFGCGCHDNRSCARVYKGLDKQLICAGDTLRKLYDASADGTGTWRSGRSKKSLDGISVRPATNATAALYGYTPWVLRGRGGNWLVWNVTRKMARHFENVLGIKFGNPDCVGSTSPFIGDPCGCPADCEFNLGGEPGICHSAGFCSIGCIGTCPDKPGRAPTFCVDDTEAIGERGMCVSKASPANGHCADLPLTIDRPAQRFVGNGDSAALTADVCLPAP